MGYIRGFVHGTVVGAVAGLCLAPQPGKRTRDQLASLGVAARDGYDIAQKTVRRVAPYAATAAQVARDRVRGHDEGGDAFSVEGGVHVRSGDGRGR